MNRVIHRTDEDSVTATPTALSFLRTCLVPEVNVINAKAGCKPFAHSSPCFNSQLPSHANHACRLTGDQLFYGRRFGTKDMRIGDWSSG